jgi:hypothetical protein
MAQVQEALDRQLAFLADLHDNAQGWGRERSETLPTAAIEQAALPTRMGGAAIKVPTQSQARIAAMCAAAAAAARLRDAFEKLDSKGFTWVADMVQTVCDFGAVPGAAPAAAAPAADAAATVTPLPANGHSAAAAAAANHPSFPRPVPINAAYPSVADAVSGAAGALDLLGACNEGWAETYALDSWISGLNDADKQIFKDLTTRVIFIPHSDEPKIIECVLPKSPHEIVASSFFSKMQHDITQASEARSHINLADINRHSTDQSQRLAALRFKYSGALFELIPSSRRFVLNSETFAFALRHRLGLNVGIGFDYNAKIADLLAKSKLADMYLHNAIRDSIASSATLGDLDIVIREPNNLWIDPMGSGPAVPDLAWRRAGITSGLDIHAHAAITTTARPLIARIASADLKKKNGSGTVAALTAARAAADAAEAAADSARQAGLSTYRELDAFAKKKRIAVHSVHTCGYDLAAVAAGHTFYSAGFTEFAGWSTSAKTILSAITHKGDALMADEEGERFDAGTEGTWATRKHRSFLIHSVAAAAARALFSAVAIESRNLRASYPLPSAKPDFDFASIHRPDIRNSRNAAMRNILPTAP